MQTFSLFLLAFVKAAISDECNLVVSALAEMGDSSPFAGICCGQNGVVCNFFNSSIEKLQWGNRSLTGQMSEKLTRLSNLTFLGLRLNKLTGSIPPSFGTLGKLQYFEIQNNFLSGEIPESIGNLAQLIGFSGNSNRFTGSIPDRIGSLMNLQILDLSGNYLTGAIPASFGRLARLQSLALGYNQLSAIPVEMAGLNALKISGIVLFVK